MAHKRVYLIRHGETPGNADRRYNGRNTDEPLSAEGLEKARRTGEVSPLIREMRDAGPRVCVSPMIRAVQTAEILFDFPEMERILDLEEIDFGIFEGKTHAELSGEASYQDWIDSGGAAAIPQGESREQFTQRSFDGFLKALGNPDRDETVAIVCHGGTIMAVMSTLTGNDYFEFMAGNLGGYRLNLETKDGNVRLISYDRFGGWDPA